MSKIIGLSYDFCDINDNYITFVEFCNEINKQEVESYIMELKQKLPCWNTEIIIEELNKKYNVKQAITIYGEDFINI